MVYHNNLTNKDSRSGKKYAVNALPDVTQGLLKRPAGKFVSSLDGSNSTADGKWFHYYRDENEQYIGQVQKNGTVNMWERCLTAAELK